MPRVAVSTDRARYATMRGAYLAAARTAVSASCRCPPLQITAPQHRRKKLPAGMYAPASGIRTPYAGNTGAGSTDTGNTGAAAFTRRK